MIQRDREMERGSAGVWEARKEREGREGRYAGSLTCQTKR